jgi:formate dehydrogenase subunit gamma
MPTAEAAPPPARIRRFSRVQISAHLLLAVAFFAMLWTGMCLYFPGLAEVMGRPLAKSVHLWSSGALVAGLAVMAAFRPRDLGRVAREAEALDRDDVAWLRGGPRRVVDHRGAPEQGWLNAGQKLATAVMLGLLVVLYGTGVVMWLGTGVTWLRIGSGAVDVHDLATILFVLLVLGHLYLALVNRATRPALRGIVTGDVDREWARSNHGRWVREMEDQGR